MTLSDVTEPASATAPARIVLWGRALPLDAVLGAALGGLLVLLGFATGGGVIPGSSHDLGANTWAEIIMTLLGAGAIVAVLLWSRRGPAHGAGALLAFAALTTLTALSVLWSVQPDDSWSAANQSVAYLGVFGAAIAMARLFPRHGGAVIGWAVSWLALGISVYALLAKVFPALPDSQSQLGRVTAPLGYWNAIGLLAALGVPGFMWIGSRETAGRIARILCIPAITILVTTVTLSYSRSADIAGFIALALLLWLTPGRLRAMLVLLPGLLAGALLTVRALSDHMLSDNFTTGGMLDGHRNSLALRTAAGHSFGWWLIAGLVLVTAAGFGLLRYAERTELTATARRRIGTGLVCLAALIPVAALGKIATSSRGFTGEISHYWDELTSTSQSIGTGPSRLTTLANSRPRYWHDALTVGSHHVLFGAGALGYATARDRYTSYHVAVENAHGYLFQAFADLGLVGLLLSLGLLVLWWRPAARTIGLRRARRPLADAESSDERTGMVLLFALVIGFGVSSAIDWTWLIPATAVPTLLCAGWLAGRGPLSEPIGRRSQRRAVLSHPALPIGITATAVVAIGLAWAIWQPLRSVQATNAAVSAAVAGHGSQALSDAQSAVNLDPFSLPALSALASIYDRGGESGRGRAELVIGTQRQGQNEISWYNLGEFDLRHGQPALALAEFQHAERLNPGNAAVQTGGAAAGAKLQRAAAARLRRRQRAAAARARELRRAAKTRRHRVP